MRSKRHRFKDKHPHNSRYNPARKRFKAPKESQASLKIYNKELKLKKIYTKTPITHILR